MAKTISLVIALGLFSILAHAQGAQDPLEACYQLPDGAPRLACFDKEMQRRHASGTTAAAASPAPIAAPATPAVPATAAAAASTRSSADDTVGLQGGALRKKLKAEGVTPEAVQPIVAKVVRVVPRAHSELAFVLDNGQTWEEAELVSNLDVKLQDTVTIKPGILGAFFLNTPRSQRVRVHRVL
jgi:hypothetical protein